MTTRTLEHAAVLMYVGSSLNFRPWDELPLDRKTAWRKTAAHLLAPKAWRNGAVQQVAANAVFTRRRRNGETARDRAAGRDAGRAE